MSNEHKCNKPLINFLGEKRDITIEKVYKNNWVVTEYNNFPDYQSEHQIDKISYCPFCGKKLW